MISSFCLIKGTPNSAMCYGEIFQNELLEVTKTKRENEYLNQNQKKGWTKQNCSTLFKMFYAKKDIPYL